MVLDILFSTVFTSQTTAEINFCFFHDYSAALEEADILFRQHAYPDEDHGIFSYHTHLYHSLTDFFLNDCFAERKTK